MDKNSLNELKLDALGKIASLDDLDSLKALKNDILGKNAPLSLASKSLKDLSIDEKKVFGPLIKGIFSEISASFNAKTEEIKEKDLQKRLVKDYKDLSSYYLPPTSLHPITELSKEIEDIFISLGWSVETGPEVECELFNFDCLNFKKNHPARAMQDTLFLESDDLLLRTHTSPVQIRHMLNNKPPIYMISLGKVFRSDEFDATHSPVFHQIEALAIDKDLNIGHLKGILEYFAHSVFGKEAKIRLRPSFFPFTEPSMELDIWHKNSKGVYEWIEWGGCGMVHPNVLQNAGIPNGYGGFAFGMGLERTLQFRHNANDLRDIYSGDIRFLNMSGIEL